MAASMNEESDELSLANERKIRHTPRYHLIGNDCLIESKKIKPALAKLVDVSNSGALIYARKNLGRAGDVINVYLRMTLNEKDRVFPVKSVIKNVRVDENFDTLMYGVEFIGINSETEFLLKNYLYKSLTE
jgi:c-di-GMP-binding flagellar brake protein YcgR